MILLYAQPSPVYTAQTYELWRQANDLYHNLYLCGREKSE